MRRIAFFDFDGTVTSKDTLLEFIKFQKRSFKFYGGFILNSPWLIAYKLGIISNHTAKERILQFFFRKTSVAEFQQQGDNFASTVIPLLVRQKALKEIKKLLEAGSDVVIVSASMENWIKKWTDSIGVKLIASRLETMDGKLTGKIDGRNCYGEEKKRRIQEAFDLSGYQEIICYGDTKGDKPMLSLATLAFYKPFR